MEKRLQMEPFDFQPSIHLLYGENRIDQLGELSKEVADPSRVLVVTDPGIASAGLLKRAMASLETAEITVFAFQQVQPNPTTRDVKNGATFARQIGGIDLIVGLGGGSAMDCAKGINFLLSNGGKMEDYWGLGKAKRPMLPSIGIPTTAGTGSEAQSYALISQAETHIKMACGDKKARFRAVILDPTLMASVPRQVAAATGIDAIAHAVESYVTTRGNPISRLLAKEGWQQLSRNFEAVLKDNPTSQVRGQMLLGAHLAGMAIECSMLGAAHACANPLTASYQITHGVAVSLMLPYVVELNRQQVDDLYQHLSSDLVQEIRRFQTLANLPIQLREVGVPESDLNDLAVEASKQWTGTFNPVPVNRQILNQLYESAY
jgi:alcohol dehydrogenase